MQDWFIHPTPGAFRFPLGAPIAWRDDDLTQKLKERTGSTNHNEEYIPKRERQFNERIAAVVAQVCFPGVEKVFLAGHNSSADYFGYDLVVQIRGPNGELKLYGFDIKSSVVGVNRRLTDFIKHRQSLKQNVQELTGWVGVFNDEWNEYILWAIREDNICEFIQKKDDDDEGKNLMEQIWSICNLLPNDFATTEHGLRLGLPLPVDLDNLENIIKDMETAFALEPHPDAFYCVQALAISSRSGFRKSREDIFELFELLSLCEDMSHKLFNAMLEFEVFVET